MDYDFPQEINGINLADYYPNQRAYNSVVYVHKKCIQKAKKEKTIEKEKKDKELKEKKAKKKVKNVKCGKCDKCQQCEQDTNNEMFLNNSLFAQSLQYARTMVPVVIPPSGIVSPVYYTIKAVKKTKDKKKPKPEVSTHTHTLKKEKSKKVVETYINDGGKESLSVKETISYSSRSDTLDELQINPPSLCCTLSEISDHKQVKKEKRDKTKHDFQKLVTSESFEALATEFLNTTGDTKIKIHLMNETEKNLLTENIRVPVLNAIRECILEVNSQRHNADSTTVQKFIKCNSQKLDNITDKLACIEQKLNYIHTDIAKPKITPPNLAIGNSKSDGVEVLKSPKVKIPKPSPLEQLGEDLIEITDNSITALETRQESSGDEYYTRPSLSARRKCRGKSAVVHLDPVVDMEKLEGMGAGEKASLCEPNTSQTSQLVRPDRAGRIPARFCWTDANRKNAG